MKACVLGLGQVGLPTALYMTDRGIDVWGYDLSEQAVLAGKNAGIDGTVHWKNVPQVDVYVVCVSTTLTRDNPNLDPVLDVCKKIHDVGNSPLVSIESTILPGTCRKLHENLFRGSVHLIHVPHRYWPDEPKIHGVRQSRVIGAVDSESLERGLGFYKEILDIPLHIAPSIEIAEMSKIAENAFRYVQIAFAEELYMICGQSSLAFKDVRKACNTKWNIEIAEARTGIKGHCLPKDIRYLSSLSENDSLMKSAIFVDNKYQQWLKAKRQPARSVIES